ncbi:amidohydrolase family protein [Amycolatopsis sp. RTGN1]|uniref:amidohydrolase family protein n=1 Tax=Amycolatopsis ponsaeliensis TaxID=2992142 RepID=UPI002549F4ED|nr:amidohydrolase family protein [Amycolatopsis sp. RTGN1]
MTGVLVRGAELDGARRADVRICDGVITAIAPALDRAPGEAVLEARGGALLPGLCDHHLHLHALAAQFRSVPCGPPGVRTTADLGAALSGARADEHGWVRGTGYHESVAGLLDASVLDRLHPARPVRVQHRSGALWTVNTAGATALRLSTGDHPGIERDVRGDPTGRLWRADDWLRERLPAVPLPDLAEVGTRLARFGITAVTDATPDLAPAAIAALTGGALSQRVLLLGVPLGHPASGPYKIILADSDLPGFATLTVWIRAAHEEGRAVAVHCVTREALVLLLAAFDETGVRPGDRIEHASLVPAELVPRIAELGLRVVTQPGFLAERGDDYLRDVPAVDQPDLYRLGSLIEAGIRCTPSSDAPYGPLDPWAVIRVATERRTPSGSLLGPGERISCAEALAGYLGDPHDPGGPPRRVRVGVAADLVLLDVPLITALRHPAADLVRETLIGGAFT